MIATFPIVTIGSSLGGLAACRKVLWALPAGFPAAVLIAQHRQADGDSLLASLLSNEGGLQASEPDDKQVIVPGHVYVAPANYHMLVERGGQNIALSTEPPVRYALPSIDVLFESVAASFGVRAVAVVLTGASDDGAHGAQAVKKAGGRVIVQTPASAESPVAPSATLARIEPDALLDIEDIAVLLRRWLPA
jgi:two-component system chemotaxis response regulator CheB